jgi:hypothetical protein
MSMGMQTVRQRVLSTIIFTVLFTGGVLSPCVATAATYYVATNGSDANPGSQFQPFRTIDKGVSVLKAGDTLYLRQGTYVNQPIGYPSPQPLPSGTSWDNAITIASAPNETATLQGANGITLLQDEHYLIFDRLVLAGSGIFLNCDAHHIRFQNGDMGNINAPSNAVAVQGCGSNLEVLHSKIHDVRVQGGCNLGNSNACYAFYWFGHDSLFDGNEVYNNDGYAYHIYGEGFRGKVSNNIIRNNRIYGNGFNGGTGGSGNIIITHGSNNQVYNNLIYGNATGIQVGTSCINCKVHNNTIYNNNGNAVDADGTDTIVQNNIAYANRGGIVNYNNATITNNLTTDPSFTNVDAMDFRLKATSPAIDAGLTLDSVLMDFSGVKRPQGPHYDIGAYECPVPVPAPKNLKATSLVP